MINGSGESSRGEAQMSGLGGIASSLMKGTGVMMTAGVQRGFATHSLVQGSFFGEKPAIVNRARLSTK